MSKQKITSVFLSFLALTITLYNFGESKTASMVTSHSAQLYVPDMRAWGPAYSNYYVGTKMKSVYFGPGNTFDQKSFWRTKLAPHSGFMHRTAEGYIYDKSAVELDRVRQ